MENERAIEKKLKEAKQKLDEQLEKNQRLEILLNHAAIQTQEGKKVPSFFEKLRAYEIQLIFLVAVLLIANLTFGRSTENV